MYLLKRSGLVLFFICLSFVLFGQNYPAFSLVAVPSHPYYGSIQLNSPKWMKVLHELEPADWKSVFKCYLASSYKTEQEGLPPMLGKVEVYSGNLYFQPRFPFMQGKSYRIVLDIKTGFEQLNLEWPEDKEPLFTQVISIPVLHQPEPTVVEKIYPTASAWPANQLKFYIEFSAPMRVGQASAFIQLLDEKGHAMEAPFLIEGQELWDREKQRLTVWFDPGRIKRGLIPNLKHGPPLEVGKSYVLKIRKDWQDVYGQALKEDFTKVINVIEPDRQKPEPENWRIFAPKAGEKTALQLSFNEPLDYALLYSSIGVFDSKGQPLKGTIWTQKEEKTWLFEPEQVWKEGAYTIRVSNDLEDLAGNNLVRLFDETIKPDSVSGSTKKLPFLELVIQILSL